MRTGLKLGLLAVLCIGATGCARKYWRKQADELSYNLIRDKQSDQRWVVDRIQVETDPRSRFYSAYDPDYEPLPPDDQAAHEFMHWAYGKRGYKHWHEFGDQPTVENPFWLEPFGMGREVVESNMGRTPQLPAMHLTLEDAIDLSYIHSRDYQTQIETLYLAALSLTQQRFAFDVQFVGLNGLRPSSTLNFADVPSTSDAANLTPNVGISQLLPTGGQWLANFANNTLWLFSKGNPSEATASTLTFQILQPLLANGGRRFVMENLTQAERSLLYAARDLMRYRMGFFTSTVAGGFTAGIQVGLAAQGVFSGVGPIPTAIANIPGATQGGYLGVIQLNQQIANTEYNIRQLRDQLERLRAQAAERPDVIGEDLAELPPGLAFPVMFTDRLVYDADEKQLMLRGQLTDLEVRQLLILHNDPAYQKAIIDLADRSNVLTTNQNIVQLETQLAGTINTLRSTRAAYQNGLDSYKLQLGLPIDTPLTVDLSLLKPFEIVDPRLVRLQDRLNAFVLEPGPVPEDHPDAEAMHRVAELMQQLSAEKEPSLPVLRGLVAEMLVLRDDLKRDGVDVTEDDFRRFVEHRQRTVPFINDMLIQPKRDPKRDERLKETLLADFRESEATLLKLRDTLAAPEVDAKTRQEALGTLGDLREEFLRISQNFSVIQIDVRVELVDLNPWEMSMEDAVATGLANRMDLMNLKGAVMDARRKVEVAANQLQAVVNLVANENIQTQPLVAGNHNPFDFRGRDSSFQVGLQFTTPIQLVAQRNTYRAAIIGYNQARRNYMRTEDQVKFDCRTNWRNLEFNRRNFETVREQIRAATAQLDIAAEQTAAPAAPVPGGAAPAAAPAAGGAGGAAGGAGGAGGGGAGGGGGGQQAQGLQIIQAVSSVLQAQNALINTWINYEAFRLDQYNFMGVLEIDAEGYWTDEFYQSRARVHRANPNRLYPPVYGPAGYAAPGTVPTSPLPSDRLNYAPAPPPPAPNSSQIASREPSPPPATSGAKEPAGHIRLVAAEEPAPQAKSPVPPKKKSSQPASAPHVIGAGTPVNPGLNAGTP